MTDVTQNSFDKAGVSTITDGEAAVIKLGHRISWGAFAPALVFLAMLLAVGVLNANYLGALGISIATATAAPILFLALGQSMVLNIGSIDLSNAAIALLGALLLALTLPSLGIVAMVMILVLVTVIGAINGAVISYAQVPSFALTLGTLAILQTAALVVSGADTIYVSENRELVSVLFETQLFNAPLTFWLGILAAVILWAVLRYTILGQNMTAMGKNELAATLSAVPVRRVRIITYALSGFLGGLAGLSIVAQAGSASASGLGSDLLLPGIAAALIGGTSISGGQTNLLNVVFGGLTVAFVPIAIQAMGLGAQAQSLVYGIFIILVVSVTTVRTRGSIIK
ncbi:ABC transporter permease [Aestuariivirga sp.]|jgi:ribose transport system permease protein|uniref:ABC transporter permease n=1 Tax=Aestuariivirga sp. TaxID=2650926 RepID=UPI003784A009